MSRPLLETRKQGLLVACLQVNHAVWTETGLSESGGEQVLSCYAPQHLPHGSSGDAGCEQRCRGTINRTVSAASNFVECADHQPPARQLPVNRYIAERQNGARAKLRALQPSHFRAEIVQTPVCGSFHNPAHPLK